MIVWKGEGCSRVKVVGQAINNGGKKNKIYLFFYTVRPLGSFNSYSYPNSDLSFLADIILVI